MDVKSLKMVFISKTGLLASPTKKVIKYHKSDTVQLRVLAKSAPYVLKPFAGLFNPYPYGCSLLCNHPADTEAKELLKRAKDTWANEGKNLLLADEVDAIRATLGQLQISVTDCGENGLYNNGNGGLPIGSVPEELFRRYTETDSRPLTPAPTLMSAHTRASGSRRCVTPDPMPTAEVREKTKLILDLRRSHSQETLSWHGSAQQHQQDVPSIKIVKAPTDTRCYSTGYTPSCTLETSRGRAERGSKSPSPVKTGKDDYNKSEKTYLEVTSAPEDDVEAEHMEDEEGAIKRRGKRRRKRGRDASRDPPAFQTSIDPETQVSAIGPESYNPSARPSLVPNDQANSTTPDVAASVQPPATSATSHKCRPSLDVDSFLDKEILKLLRRELNKEVIENEFNLKRRKALEETMKTVRSDKTDCDELRKLQEELKLPPTNEDLWLCIPRIFSRSSARFELPMDSRMLSTMTPLQYVQEHVSVSTTRKQLYNCIFNRHKSENDIDNEHQYVLGGPNVLAALNEMMGQSMSEKQAARMRGLMGWKDEDVLDFKTFCGLCALCERLLAPEYCPHLPSRKADPCHEIETVDFQLLLKRVNGQTLDERLLQILQLIKDS